MSRHLTTLIVSLLFLTPVIIRAEGPPIMQPQVYVDGMEVTGWLMSEKLDGVRGYWDGHRLVSKNGIEFHPPAEFIKNFPDFPIEGEIWGGRRTFEKTVSFVKQEKNPAGWLTLKFAIFDAPEIPGGFTARLTAVKDWFADHPSAYAYIIEQTPVLDRYHINASLEQVEAMGGEGLILRKPDSLYVKGRCPDILKVKSYEDAEAIVIAHVPGSGRNKERMGALLVKLPGTKIRFRIGSGFTDEMRQNPPPVGSIITFKFYGRHEKSGIPRFPSFLRIKSDQDL